MRARGPPEAPGAAARRVRRRGWIRLDVLRRTQARRDPGSGASAFLLPPLPRPPAATAALSFLSAR
eukprot:4706911-Pyramimonas_sp.AAC.1